MKQSRLFILAVLVLMTVPLFSEDNQEEADKKQKHLTCADDYISALLANETKGKTKKCNKLLKQGLKLYPDDYLLLYHGGRITNDKREDERLLIKSVYANPAFEETHLLLGEKMYHGNDYLKTVLPLFYFLLLENDTERSYAVVLMLENLFEAWAQGKTPENHLNFGIECNFIPTAYIPTKNRSEKYRWLVEQILNLMEAMNSVKTLSADVLWEFYSDFFANAVETENTNALARHLVYSRYPAEVLEWISGNGLEYKRMIDWLTLQ
jgi:hypothetical protein